MLRPSTSFKYNLRRNPPSNLIIRDTIGGTRWRAANVLLCCLTQRVSNLELWYLPLLSELALQLIADSITSH